MPSAATLFNDPIVRNKLHDNYNKIRHNTHLRDEIIERIREVVSTGRITVTQSEDSLQIYTRSQKGLGITNDALATVQKEYPTFNMLFRVMCEDKVVILKFRRHRTK